MKQIKILIFFRGNRAYLYYKNAAHTEPVGSPNKTLYINEANKNFNLLDI